MAKCYICDKHYTEIRGEHSTTNVCPECMKDWETTMDSMDEYAKMSDEEKAAAREDADKWLDEYLANKITYKWNPELDKFVGYDKDGKKVA